MKDIVDFFRDNTIAKVSFLISIVSFVLSAYNFIIDLVRNQKRIEVSFGFMTKRIANRQYIQINIVNRSCKPISITNVQLENHNGILNVLNERTYYMRAERKAGDEVISRSECYTATTPFYICELGCYSGCFMLASDDKWLKPNETVKLTIGTNRGKIKKKLVAPEKYDIPKRISAAELPL